MKEAGDNFMVRGFMCLHPHRVHAWAALLGTCWGWRGPHQLAGIPQKHTALSRCFQRGQASGYTENSHSQGWPRHSLHDTMDNWPTQDWLEKLSWSFFSFHPCIYSATSHLSHFLLDDINSLHLSLYTPQDHFSQPTNIYRSLAKRRPLDLRSRANASNK